MGMSEMVGRKRRKKRGMRGEKGWMRYGKGKKELQMWDGKRRNEEGGRQGQLEWEGAQNPPKRSDPGHQCQFW